MRDKRRVRERQINVSRLVYISVLFVTAEQPTKSHKRGKYGGKKTFKTVNNTSNCVTLFTIIILFQVLTYHSLPSQNSELFPRASPGNLRV